MSYITFDYKCPECGAEYPNCFVKRSEMDKKTCGKCYTTLLRMPPATRTTFVFADPGLKK